MVRLRSAGLTKSYRMSLRESGVWLLGLVPELGKTLSASDGADVVDKWLERAVELAYKRKERLYRVNLGLVAIQRAFHLSAPLLRGAWSAVRGWKALKRSKSRIPITRYRLEWLWLEVTPISMFSDWRSRVCRFCSDLASAEMCAVERSLKAVSSKKKAKTPETEKAVASSSKRKTTSEGASASKRQSILAPWGAETVESFQEDFLEVESSQEYKDGKLPPEDIAASFFDQQQCSMVVGDKKGSHHVCTTSAGEHGFFEFTFQGLEHTTEIPNLALESVQACALKRPAEEGWMRRRWIGCALDWWLGFVCLLRPGEILNLRCQDVSLPEGQGVEIEELGAVVVIRQPKTRRVWKEQFVTCKDPALVKVVELVDG